MASIQELKERIDLHDLAEKLGLVRPGGRGNYKSPHHDDKSPSLSVFKEGTRWKDFSSGRGGTSIDLVMYVRNVEVDEAIRILHDLYGWTPDKPAQKTVPRERTLPEFIAERCLARADGCMEYLRGRGLPENVITHAIKCKTLGWNTWTAEQATPKPGRTPAKPGEIGYGGPAAAFIVRDLRAGGVVAVDLRYADPDLNGGLKTQTQGPKEGHVWCSDRRAVLRAKTVYVVESPINALSIEACAMPYTAAVAVRGVATVESIDWHFLRNKRVVLCFDNDEPDDKGHRPGAVASWALLDLLNGLNISTHLVDQGDWEHNDVNDILCAEGPEGLRSLLRHIEPWAIPGLPGNREKFKGNARLWLDGHHYAQYWRYRCKEDFTTYVRELGQETDDGKTDTKFEDVAGFRIASLQRVAIASATATMTGDDDAQPSTLFAATVQTPGSGNSLERRVFEPEKLHKDGQWTKLGKVYNPNLFARLVNIWEKQAAENTRPAINFVGLAWRNGKPVVSEGPDCFFSNPEQQCPYHNLVFPSGTPHDARRVIAAYQSTFGRNAAAIMLVWSLGGHLKAFLRFWPHMIVQARKAAGKSTLIKRLESTIAFTMFSGQSIQTIFRILTSISATSHPVGWEELSARAQNMIDTAVSQLQECYNHSETRRGAELTHYLLSAPVLLAGEDVPVRSLTGKVCAVSLETKGPLLPEDLPKFPVRQWLDFLAKLSRPDVTAMLKDAEQYCRSLCRATGNDYGAERMVTNYAAILVAWRLLCRFADVDESQADFPADLVQQMNNHIQETSQDREPWVWIVELLCSEIAAGRYMHPYTFDTVDGELCLIIRTGHVMDHIAHTPALRDVHNMLPVKSDRVFRRQLIDNQIVVGNSYVDRTIRKKQIRNMTALSIEKIESYGISVPVDIGPPPVGW